MEMDKVEVFGEVPLARFGHTITLGNSPLFNSQPTPHPPAVEPLPN